MSPDEFTAVVERETWPLFRLCFSFLHCYEDAEDSLQACWLKAWIAIDRAPADATEQRMWLYAIARNTCLDRLRLASRRPVIMPEDVDIAAPGSVEDTVIQRCELAEVFAVVALLAPGQRCVVAMAARGIGERESGMSHGTFASRLFRARERLRAGLAA